MLIYDKGWWGLPLLFRGFPCGSPVTRALLFPLLSMLETLCLFQVKRARTRCRAGAC